MKRPQIEGRMVPLDRDAVDTDTIMPQEFLTRTEREGFGEAVFHHWRTSGQIDLDDPVRLGARILVASRNFGTGSSREHAVWGLKQWGFEAVIAVEFGDIFARNCLLNGIAAVTISEEECRWLRYLTESDPGATMIIDLEAQRIAAGARTIEFSLPPIARLMLINGLDEIGLTEGLESAILRHEADRPDWMPRMLSPQSRESV
ncbi:3-isopropylmalate dehydratase small subunit [Arthrobacter sp. MI7-26]|uniref:3-isopropylmalate dehydratase small subunit n=1 Tax=Arthrobacter sp. MI7-26 TaxID=2993653 RepID=UPI002249974D|nr:3-isopropylmalate dehydratase small subunit [Arthrobacter sp. MI7-26]MCX2750324.1 3-isopropylmalate dehydratase small subunit [Arthrobacter sp. MI7-26]